MASEWSRIIKLFFLRFFFNFLKIYRDYLMIAFCVWCMCGRAVLCCVCVCVFIQRGNGVQDERITDVYAMKLFLKDNSRYSSFFFFFASSWVIGKHFWFGEVGRLEVLWGEKEGKAGREGSCTPGVFWVRLAFNLQWRTHHLANEDIYLHKHEFELIAECVDFST